MGRYNSNTLWRLYQIGGPELALRYAEIASSRHEPKDEYAKGSDLEIVDLRFFTGGSTKPELSAREYGARFATGATRYVYYQMDLRSPWRYSSFTYTIRACYYNSAGALLSDIKDEFKTRPDEPLFSRSRGCGQEELRNWKPGTYRVEFSINDKPVRTAEFTIFDDAPARPAPSLYSAFESPLFPETSLKPGRGRKPMSVKKPLALGFDGWMEKFKTDFASPAGQETFNPTAPMDGLTRMRRLMDIDRRYMYATMQARPGRTTAATVQELKTIAQDYEQLLQAGAPGGFFKEEDVRRKVADATSAAAGACANLRQYPEAEKLYRSAAATYNLAGQPEEAKRCQERIAEFKYLQDGNVDSEIRRLKAKVSKAGANSVDQADALIELGSLYGSNGDDYEARKLLEQAEAILKKRAPDPSGADLANALTASLTGIGAGKPLQFGGIEDSLRVQGLYRLLYVALAKAYQTSNPKKAAEYRSKAAQRDSREMNDDFSQTMLRILNEGKLL
jgi:hypothetical protein